MMNHNKIAEYNLLPKKGVSYDTIIFSTSTYTINESMYITMYDDIIIYIKYMSICIYIR